MKYPVITRPTVYNNVRFVPPRKKTWYRSKSGGRCTHSTIRLGERQLCVSYFTYARGRNKGDGYSVALYKDGVIVAYGDLMNANFVVAQNIASAEKKALEWMQTCEEEHGTETQKEKETRRGTKT